MSDEDGFWFLMMTILLILMFGGAQCQVSVKHEVATEVKGYK
jgi:hypothetical protein